MVTWCIATIETKYADSINKDVHLSFILRSKIWDTETVQNLASTCSGLTRPEGISLKGATKLRALRWKLLFINYFQVRSEISKHREDWRPCLHKGPQSSGRQKSSFLQWQLHLLKNNYSNNWPCNISQGTTCKVYKDTIKRCYIEMMLMHWPYSASSKWNFKIYMYFY
jgi:hypothetical protein